MTTREPLLPCPFCGAKMAMRGDYTHDHAWNFYTHEDREERDNCILSQYEIPCGPDFTTPAKSLADAWNRRAMPLQDHAEPDIRWAVNVLLEKIAEKFEGWETMDIWRSDAAMVVRGFKHPSAAVRAVPQNHAAEKPKDDLADQIWTEFVAACEYYEEEAERLLQTPDDMAPYYRGQKQTAKSIRRQVDHPKYRRPMVAEDQTSGAK